MSTITDYANAAAWKHDNASGIRFFQDPKRAKKLKIDVILVGSFAMVWPDALGDCPSLERLEAWVAEWKTAVQKP